MQAESARSSCYDGDFALKGEEGLEVLKLDVCGGHSVGCDGRFNRSWFDQMDNVGVAVRR